MVDTLRDIILNDHFGGDMPDTIINLWLQALTSSTSALPPNIHGFYGCSLRPSLPIELSRGSYKYIAHEVSNREKIQKYGQRMLIVLALLDMDKLEAEEPALAALGLWHRSLAEVRLEGDEGRGLKSTLQRFERVRGRVSLGEGKIPNGKRLRERLRMVAVELNNEEALEVIDNLDREEDESKVRNGSIEALKSRDQHPQGACTKSS